jgi:hypothetical protein
VKITIAEGRIKRSEEGKLKDGFQEVRVLKYKLE